MQTEKLQSEYSVSIRNEAELPPSLSVFEDHPRPRPKPLQENCNASVPTASYVHACEM